MIKIMSYELALLGRSPMSLLIASFIIHNFQFIINIDHRILLAINHARTPALDAVMTFASQIKVWFPFYAVLLGWLIYHFRRRAGRLLLLLAATVALADSISSRVFKPWAARPRPCHAADLAARLYLARWLRRAIRLPVLARRQRNGPGRVSASSAAHRPLPGPQNRRVSLGTADFVQPRVPGRALPARRAGRLAAGRGAGRGRGLGFSAVGWGKGHLIS